MENEKPAKKRLLWQLFLSTLYISAFTFGGGYVIITFMKRKFVDGLHWISNKEMLDYAALAQSAPGAVAVNAAILVGYDICGFTGMIVAILGTILPPLIILSVISLFYSAFASNLYVALVLKGMQAGVAAVIFDVVLSLGIDAIKEKSILSDAIMIIAFFAACFLNINVIFIILAAAFIGVMKAIIYNKREAKR
ncbi:MAG: chromate transporter [Clostridia bacterium]|jgi:chromate transporter|nr:chromate transporter [Clostridia bacterium]MCI2014873.1 chromate transporter [Clostridia bacterium]